jgi:hypothetical protein
MKIKRFIAAILILCALFSIGSAVARFPPGDVVYDVTYYSDYSYSTRVGNERWTCTGYMNWGQRTVYRIERTWPCDDQ